MGAARPSLTQHRTAVRALLLVNRESSVLAVLVSQSVIPVNPAVPLAEYAPLVSSAWPLSACLFRFLEQCVATGGRPARQVKLAFKELVSSPLLSARAVTMAIPARTGSLARTPNVSSPETPVVQVKVLVTTVLYASKASAHPLVFRLEAARDVTPLVPPANIVCPTSAPLIHSLIPAQEPRAVLVRSVYLLSVSIYSMTLPIAVARTLPALLATSVDQAHVPLHQHPRVARPSAKDSSRCASITLVWLSLRTSTTAARQAISATEARLASQASAPTLATQFDAMAMSVQMESSASAMPVSTLQPMTATVVVLVTSVRTRRYASRVSAPPLMLLSVATRTAQMPRSASRTPVSMSSLTLRTAAHWVVLATGKVLRVSLANAFRLLLAVAARRPARLTSPAWTTHATTSSVTRTTAVDSVRDVQGSVLLEHVSRYRVSSLILLDRSRILCRP